MPTIGLDNTLGLLGLLSLIPFILLYLIRPKPKLMTIPSLMFFIRISGANKVTSFLRHFVQDLLFFIQLFTLLFLALTLAIPYTNYTHNISAQNTVIVIDASASSQVKESSKTRFEISLEKALQNLGKRNSIIIAKNTPFLGVKDASSSEAAEFLRNLKPTETPTRLGESIIYAGELLEGKEGRVIVLSDFINTQGQDPTTAKAILQSKNIIVDFINVASGKKSNVGIIDLVVEDDSTSVQIKNFDANARSVKIVAGKTEKDIQIGPGSIEPFVFKTPEGLTKVELKLNDDFQIDNTAYISAPGKSRVSVLLITNNKSIFVENALKSTGLVDLTIEDPPVVSTNKDFDIYVIHDINPTLVLSGTWEQILKRVETGASVIVHAQEKQEKIDLKGLLPLDIKGIGERSELAIVQKGLKLVKYIDSFGILINYYIVKPREFVPVVTAGEGTDKQSMIIGFTTHGKGKIMYYGILEKGSDFRFSPSYPIFWAEVVKFLTDREDIKTLNKKTGEVLSNDKPTKIDLPSGKSITQTLLLLENTGVYNVGGKKVAVNLVNEFESAIISNQSFGQKNIEAKLEPVTEKRKYSFEIIMLIIIILLLIAEIVYIKLRGDI